MTGVFFVDTARMIDAEAENGYTTQSDLRKRGPGR